MPTSAPASASATAVAAPMPRPAPVTTATRPSRRNRSSTLTPKNNNPGGRSALQVGEHGEHATTALRRLDDAQLGEHAAHVGFHGSAGDEQLVADRVVGIPLGHEAEDLAFPVGQRLERVPLPAAAQQLADDLGIDDAFA